MIRTAATPVNALVGPPLIVMCDFGSRTARWGLDVPATLLARADEVMNAECPLLGVKRTLPETVGMSANDPKRTSKELLMPVAVVCGASIAFVPTQFVVLRHLLWGEYSGSRQVIL